jgi:hypothetical protein
MLKASKSKIKVSVDSLSGKHLFLIDGVLAISLPGGRKATLCDRPRGLTLPLKAFG